MPKFIKLTERYSDGREHVIILNTDYILSVKKASGGPDTHIVVNGTRPSKKGEERVEVFFFVKETVEQIEGMLE